jgi:hypothetical protein
MKAQDQTLFDSFTGTEYTLQIEDGNFVLTNSNDELVTSANPKDKVAMAFLSGFAYAAFLSRGVK